MTQSDHLQAARAILWLQWVALNGAGWGLGLFILEALRLPWRPVVIGLAALLAGVAQWRLLRAYLRNGALRWPMATAVGALLGQSVSQQLVSAFAGRLQGVGDSLPAAFLLGGLLGCLLGLGIGFWQGRLFQGQMGGAWAWTAVNAAAWSVALAISALFILPFALAGTLSALIAAGGTGLWLARHLVPAAAPR